MSNSNGDSGDDVTDQLLGMVEPQPVENREVYKHEISPTSQSSWWQEGVTNWLGNCLLKTITNLLRMIEIHTLLSKILHTELNFRLASLTILVMPGVTSINFTTYPLICSIH